MDRLLEKPRNSTSGVFRFLGSVLTPPHHDPMPWRHRNTTKKPENDVAGQLGIGFFLNPVRGYREIKNKKSFNNNGIDISYNPMFVFQPLFF